MRIHRAAPMSAMIALLVAPLLHSQVAPPPTEKIPEPSAAPHPPMIDDGWHRSFPGLPEQREKPAPPPRRDISGTWDPGPTRGIQVLGAAARPDDGNPAHQPPYTPFGLEMLSHTKPSAAVRSVLPGETNDPIVLGDPQGMPREDLYELRVTQIVQSPEKVFVLYTYGRVWRVIWTDGRDFPKDPEPRWFGYSIGKWVDDTTLLVETRGVDERTWIDRAGRPHSGDMRVLEWFHRVDYDHLELSLEIDDPKMYTKPWVALNKLPFGMRPSDFDVREMIYAPSDVAEYNKLLGNPVSNMEGH